MSTEIEPAPKVGMDTQPSKNRGRAGMGRPKGATNKATREVRDIARAYGPDAIKRAAELAGLILDEETKMPRGKAESEQAQISALGIILDRAYGKAAQPQTGEDGEGPVKTVLEIVWAANSGSSGSA